MKLHTLTNRHGVTVDISTFGGIVTRLMVPDRNGDFTDVVLGFDNPEDYRQEHPYFGAIIGRFANRIDAGKFTLDGAEYTLPCNNENRCLHGGLLGFDKQIWDDRLIEGEGFSGVELCHRSLDGEEGFPGNLDVVVTYKLMDDNALIIEYSADTDQPTVLNLTNHSYFNLAGQAAGSILAHEVRIPASHYLPVTNNIVPTGEVAAVTGTPFDFRTAKQPSVEIDADHPQLKLGEGFDHTWVLDDAAGTAKLPGVRTLAAEVYEPSSGRFMEVFTDEPGVQFYAGNVLDGTVAGKGGCRYQKRHGFCLETQHFPDSPNHPEFPSTRLDPGQTYRSTTLYRFSTQ